MIDRNEIAKTARTERADHTTFADFDINGIHIESSFDEYERTEVIVNMLDGNQRIAHYVWNTVDLGNDDFSVVIEDLDRKVMMMDLGITFDETLQLIATIFDYLQDEMSYSWGKTITQSIAASSLR